MSLKNTDPQFIHDLFALLTEYLSSYGWYILAFIILLYVSWNKYVSKLFAEWRETRNRNTDPNVIANRAEEMEEVRRRMQERYNASAEQRNAAIIEEQTKKRQQLIELQRIADQQTQLKKRTDNSKSLFGDKDYNPLMGSSSSSSYRPARKNCGPSGG